MDLDTRKKEWPKPLEKSSFSKRKMFADFKLRIWGNIKM